eukprot:tig00000692_g3257.t1
MHSAVLKRLAPAARRSSAVQRRIAERVLSAAANECSSSTSAATPRMLADWRLPHIVASRHSAVLARNAHSKPSVLKPRSGPPPLDAEGLLDEHVYHEAADAQMDRLHDWLEPICEAEEEEDFDLELSMGVLTLKLGRHGTYVINKQAPNRQIWFSSPLSGPGRYNLDYAGGLWRSNRDTRSLEGVLSAELSKMLGRPIPPPVS